MTLVSECYLKIFRSQKFVETRRISLWPALIGRSGRASLVLNSEQIEEEHCKLELREEGVAFFSLVQSEQNPQLNGKPTKRSFLRVGDVLTIGPYDIAFYDSEPAQTAVPPLFAPKEEVLEKASIPLSMEDPNDNQGFQQKAVEEKIRKDIIQKRKKEREASIPKIDVEAPRNEHTQVDSLSENKKNSNTTPTLVNASIFRPLSLEVVFFLGEEIVDVFHFEGHRDIFIGGNENCDIPIPVFEKTAIKYRLATIGPQTKIYLNNDFEAQLLSEGGKKSSLQELAQSGRLLADGAVHLSPQEQVKMDFPHSEMSVIIRYRDQAPQPVPSPFLDMTVSELVVLVMSFLVSGLWAMYISVNVPAPEEEKLIELAEPIRYAQLVYKPKPAEPEEPVEEKQEKIEKVKIPEKKKPSPKAKVAEKTKVKKKLVSKAKKKKTRRKVKKKRVVRKKPTPSQRVRPKNLPKAPKKVTSFRQGGSKRLGKKPGASAATKKKDLSKVGILGILGSGGYRPNTDKASTGVGILQGISTEMTGGVGESEDLLGKNLGVKLKDDGAGSTGFATTGIDDVGTKGLGGGVPALETVGIGKRVRPEIEFGGDEEEFIGKIDPEAIRRVIRSNKNQLENCYERQLNKNRELASGKVIIGWKLAVGGRVLDPQMKSVSPGFSEVGDCVIRRLQTWRFPEPPAGQEVEISAYPFLFEKR